MEDVTDGGYSLVGGLFEEKRETSEGWDGALMGLPKLRDVILK